MDDVEYAKLNHKKRRGKPQQTNPHLEEPATIVYADIKTSHIQLPVEDPKPDITENTVRSFKCRNITKLLILIILILSCALAFLIYNQFKKTASSTNENGNTTSSVIGVNEIKKQLCLNKNEDTKECILCLNGWLLHRETCYYIYSGGDHRTWNESREMCEGMGAHLLVIEDLEQQGFIQRSIKQQTDGHFWIGLYRDGDGWRWVDGRLYNTGLFQISEEYPGDCVWWGADSGYYKDGCQSKQKWICQKRGLKI